MKLRYMLAGSLLTVALAAAVLIPLATTGSDQSVARAATGRMVRPTLPVTPSVRTLRGNAPGRDAHVPPHRFAVHPADRQLPDQEGPGVGLQPLDPGPDPHRLPGGANSRRGDEPPPRDDHRALPWRGGAEPVRRSGRDQPARSHPGRQELHLQLRGAPRGNLRLPLAHALRGAGATGPSTASCS